MSNLKGKATSMTLTRTTLPKSHGMWRSSSVDSSHISRSIRVVVLGVAGVGKTAMSVRFVTKRFIGDYDPTLETIYRHTTVVDDQFVHFEIMDTAGQEENSLLLEDKCKWGESFIFVYDVTDKYSFDELSRLKFIASYTHSRMRLNFTPCWILVGNKADLADRDRMVTTEEGRALAQNLGCHVFREISAKESMDESSEVFSDLWREFSRQCPKSPSSSQRRKFSCRIQDKISVLHSKACTCPPEILQSIGSNGLTSSLVPNVKCPVRRQSSVPIMTFGGAKHKDCAHSKEKINEDTLNFNREIPCIPEHNDEVDRDDVKFNFSGPWRKRRDALITSKQECKSPGLSPFSFTRSLLNSKSMSVDNVFLPHDLTSCSSSELNSPLTSSSTSSSNTSLNTAVGPMLNSACIFRTPKPTEESASNTSGNSSRHLSEPPSNEDLMILYRGHCKSKKCCNRNSSRCHHTFSDCLNEMKFSNSTQALEGF